MSTFNMPPGVTTNDIPGNESVCVACQAGDHDATGPMTAECGCPCHNDDEPLGAQLDRERITDAREELNSLLPSILCDIEDVVRRLDRAHREATFVEPVTALLVADAMAKADSLQTDLRILITARTTTQRQLADVLEGRERA